MKDKHPLSLQGARVVFRTSGRTNLVWKRSRTNNIQRPASYCNMRARTYSQVSRIDLCSTYMELACLENRDKGSKSEAGNHTTRISVAQMGSPYMRLFSTTGISLSSHRLQFGQFS